MKAKNKMIENTKSDKAKDTRYFVPSVGRVIDARDTRDAQKKAEKLSAKNKKEV